RVLPGFSSTNVVLRYSRAASGVSEPLSQTRMSPVAASPSPEPLSLPPVLQAVSASARVIVDATDVATRRFLFTGCFLSVFLGGGVGDATGGVAGVLRNRDRAGVLRPGGTALGVPGGSWGQGASRARSGCGVSASVVGS